MRPREFFERMVLMKRMTALTCLIWLIAPACAGAQDSPQPPAAGSSTSKQEASSAQKEKPAKQDGKSKAAAQPGQDQELPAGAPSQAAKKPLPPPHLTLGVGWANWNLDGNEHKFRQYATPPQGIFLNELRYVPSLHHDTHTGLISLKGFGEDDFRLDGNLALFNGNTKIEGWLTRNKFFDTTPVVIDPSDRRIQEVAIKQHVAPGFSLSARYRMDEQNQSFDPPSQPLHQRTRYSDVNAEGKVGPGFLSVGFADWRYFDRTQVLPDNTVQRVNLNYLWQAHARLAVEGGYSQYAIWQQNGRPKSTVDTLAFSGDLALASATDMELTFKRDRRDLSVVQNGFLRDVRSGGLTLVHRWPKWSVQLGFQGREAERVRGDQSFVDTPHWFIFNGKLLGRLSKETRLSIKGSTQTLSRVPPAITNDTRSLFFDSKTDVQVKIDAGAEYVSAYVVGAYRRFDNSARGVLIQNKSMVAGGTWQIDPRLNSFIEISFDNWNAVNDVSLFPVIENFAANGRTFVFGLNWATNQRTYMSATVTDSATTNDNPLLLRDGNTSSTYFTLNVHHRLPAGHEVGLIFSPWRYRDRVVSAMSYDTAVIMATASAKF